MSNLTLWSRPAWNSERWLREFFGPAAVTDWFKPIVGDGSPGFMPAAEIVKDGDDAVVRLELPGSMSTSSSTSTVTAGWNIKTHNQLRVNS